MVDSEHCVNDSREKRVKLFSTDQKRPPISLVWLVKLGTNFTRSEILKLEYADFHLP